jgi:hypothetical protein
MSVSASDIQDIGHAAVEGELRQLRTRLVLRT